jgi:hypothetical protein
VNLECPGCVTRFSPRSYTEGGDSLRAKCFRIPSRLWASRRWHAGLAIAALAIGIGANTGVFSVVDALLLSSLSFHEPDRLALLHQFIPPHASAEEFHEWRRRSAYLADTALFEESDVNLGGARVGEPSARCADILEFFLGAGHAAGITTWVRA